MVTKVEETIDMNWIRTVMEKYNPHVEGTEDPIADFRFKRPEWAICATAYSPAYIPLDADQYIKFREPRLLGINNMTPFALAEWDEPSTFRQRSARYRPNSFNRVFSATPTGVGQLRESFPDFFEDDKRLVFLPGDDQSPEKVRETVQDIRGRGDKPQNYVFFPVMHGGSQPVGEFFYEYVVALHFIEKGYVPTQYGARNVRGVPDLFVYRLPEVASVYGGRFALEFLLHPDGDGIAAEDTSSKSFAIEAEPTSQRVRSSGDSGVGQIREKGYHRPFSGGISTGPSDQVYSQGRIGMVVLGSNAEKIVEYPETLSAADEKAIYGFKEYLKFLLLESSYDELQASTDGFSAYVDRLAEFELDELLG